jgi:hypothetical protein
VSTVPLPRPARPEDVEAILTILANVEGLRQQLDNFIKIVTLELETVQVKLSRILQEVQFEARFAPPSVSIST